VNEINKKIKGLVSELEREAFYHGRADALYVHHPTFHTLAKRKELLDHKGIKEQVHSEINHLLEEEAKP
jgi:hypothetical protein